MAFTRDKNKGHPMSSTKIGSDIVIPSSRLDESGDVGQSGDLPESQRITFPGEFEFSVFDGSADENGDSHDDIFNDNQFDDTYWNTIQHSLWFRDTNSTTT